MRQQALEKLGTEIVNDLEALVTSLYSPAQLKRTKWQKRIDEWRILTDRSQSASVVREVMNR